MYNFAENRGNNTAEAAKGWLNLTNLPRIKFWLFMVQTTDKTIKCNVAAVYIAKPKLLVSLNCFGSLRVLNV